MVSKRLGKEFPILLKLEEKYGDIGSVKVQKATADDVQKIMKSGTSDMVSRDIHLAEQGVVFFFEYNDKIAIRHVWCVVIKTTEKINYETVGTMHEYTLGTGFYSNGIAKFIGDIIPANTNGLIKVIDATIVDSMKPSTIAVLLNNKADRISSLCYSEYQIHFLGDDRYGSIVMKLVRVHPQD